MKKILFILLLLFSIYIASHSQNVFADEISDYVKDNVNNLEINDFENYLNECNINTNIKDEILKIINGEYSGNVIDFFNLILKYISTSLTNYIPIIVSIIIISLIQSMIESFSSSFMKNEIKEIVYFVSYAAILLVIIYKIYEIIDNTKKIIAIFVSSMEYIFPVLLTLVTIIGGNISVGTYKPLMVVLTSLISFIVNSIVMPIFSGIIVLCIISKITKNFKLDKMISFLKSISNWTINGIFSIFVTFLTFQGLTSGIIDTISIKSTKFALESYVPILGGYLSDGYDLILASLVLIKNSFGVVSISIVLSIIVIPIINILIFSLTLRLSSAIVEPIADNRISDMLYDMSKNIMILVGVLVSIFAMFLILTMMIILSCNLGAV